MEIDVNIIPVPTLSEIPVSLITGQENRVTDFTDYAKEVTIPMMVDDSHVIPMMVEDVTKPKPKAKPKRESKTKIVTGEVKIVSAEDFPAATDTDVAMPNERKWAMADENTGMSVAYGESGKMEQVSFGEDVALDVQAAHLINSVVYTEVQHDDGTKTLIDPLPAFNGAPYTIQNVTTPEGQDRKVFSIDLANLKPETASAYVENVTKLMGSLSVEPNRNKRVYHIDVGDIDPSQKLDALIETVSGRNGGGRTYQISQPEAEWTPPTLQHITMPVSQTPKMRMIELSDLVQPEELSVVEVSHTDIYRAAYYAERAEMQVAHLDSPAFDTSIKTPLVK